MAVSSEYLITGVVLVPVQSLVYNVNNIGDRTVPWGAPVFVVQESEKAFSKHTD
jgi:hypothetical protein